MDNLSNIESNRNNQHMATEITLKTRLHDGTRVEERLYESVLRQVRAALPRLKQDVNYTAKKLCGKAFWCQLEKYERLQAGKCLVDIVHDNLLPLNFAGKNKENAQLYQLK